MFVMAAAYVVGLVLLTYLILWWLAPSYDFSLFEKALQGSGSLAFELALISICACVIILHLWFGYMAWYVVGFAPSRKVRNRLQAIEEALT